MKFYLDAENSNEFSYSYATFEESIGGKPLLVNKNQLYLIIPVINQGVYDLKTFNNGSSTPLYLDRSYYLFSKIKKYNESIWLRNNKEVQGEFENYFVVRDYVKSYDTYKVELEMGFNGDFTYGATWKVESKTFGILVPASAKSSPDENKYYQRIENLNQDDLEFLLNQNQGELELFIKELE